MEARFEDRDGRRVIIVSEGTTEIVATGVTDLAGKCYRAGIDGREATKAWSRALQAKAEAR